jgi:hypothetical protein
LRPFLSVIFELHNYPPVKVGGTVEWASGPEGFGRKKDNFLKARIRITIGVFK